MVGIEKNNKEQKSQGKKPLKSSKVLKLIKEAKANKPQPDQMADSKKVEIDNKILKIYTDHPRPDSLLKAFGSVLLKEYSLLQVKKKNIPIQDRKKNILKIDKDDIVEKIDEIKLERSCADFYVKTTEKKPLKIYLRILKISIIKMLKKLSACKILVKYISSINGEIIEKELEFEHEIIDPSHEIAKSFLEKKNLLFA